MQKRVCYCLIILETIIFIFSSCVLGDDYDEYIEDIEKTLSTEIQASASIEAEPSINARHSIVMERGTKEILFGKKENEKCKMASTTKIMTAIIVIENCGDLEKIETISEKAARTGGSRLGLKSNCKIKIKDLLYGLMMVSGNDAAIALSEIIGGSTENFINMMNQKAKDLELKDTHFETPHGLDAEEHYTTAYDLARLADYALNNSTFAKIVKTASYTITIDDAQKQLRNTNELLGYLDGVYGVKTGFTNGANRCLVTACKRENLDVICVVLGCDTKKDRTLDSINLINYVFKNFTKVNIKDVINTKFENWKILHMNSFFVNKGINSKLDLCLNEEQLPYNSVAMKKDLIENISIKILVPFEFDAPLPENAQIGIMQVFLDEENIFNIQILNKNEIIKKDIIYYLKSFLEKYCSYF